MSDKHFCCSNCGSHYDLSSCSGRTAARYGMCAKCMADELIEKYRRSKFGIDKIKGFIPYLVLLFGYRLYKWRQKKA